MKAHPIADLFPMLAEDELTELADDIKQRGLLHPIVLDADGLVLDGRNRLAACELAGVEPEFTTYEGDDPDGYALTVNVNRRSLTRGQRSMVAADAEFFLRKKYGEQRKLARLLGVSDASLSKAKTVREFAPDTADFVASGTKPLNEAYEVARQRKRDKESDDQAVAEVRAEAPDLADEIAEERLSLDDAMELLEQRRADAEVRVQVLQIDEQRNADGAPEPSFAQRVESGGIGWDEALTLARQWQKERADAIRRSQVYVREVISAWKIAPSLRLNHPDRPFVRDVLAAFDDPADLEAIKGIVEAFGGDV